MLIAHCKRSQLISNLFSTIATDGPCCYGPTDVMWALEEGIVDTIIVYENLAMRRLVLRNNSTSESKVVYASEERPVQLNDDWVIVEDEPLLDYLIEARVNKNIQLKLVSDETSEGKQFVLGFGGLAALLRYKVDFPTTNPHDDSLWNDDVDEDDIDWDAF